MVFEGDVGQCHYGAGPAGDGGLGNGQGDCPYLRAPLCGAVESAEEQLAHLQTGMEQVSKRLAAVEITRSRMRPNMTTWPRFTSG